MREGGPRAPDFSLLTAGSGRRVELRSEKGRLVVLIFHLQGTAPTAREINHAIRARYPSADDILVASIIDLSFVPPVYWLTVGLVLNGAYETAAASLPEEAEPSDYVVILPDWNGMVSREYGAQRTGRSAVVVVVDRDSRVALSYRGERPVEPVLEAIAGHR